ncbi:Nop52-domain-containing protein [Laetiporus sulphureus 93-53]|uniref:Nop52-domain-containing protein n=1 Tax=Laetiporus sulphureus 93-53 TaxID=1314785 RepID=A0A165F7I8_9APHY|nr:Nop52-domain-containing protein [Laetiporus sulphureus 93-53]KZT08541.1 Nop52-domain-containing protein [Laetiporus sulphureus 93-53]
MTESSSSSNAPPLGRYLASTDKKTRDKAIKNLSLFLSDSSRDTLSKSEMARLWKGIFYCFWMSDKPLVQQALASELAGILLSVSTPSVALAFLRGFWEATVREWTSIDRLRIDKYYMLIRRFVNASFRLLMRTGWDGAACDEYNSILTVRGGPLCSDDIRVPSSLSYHLADIYLEELDKAYDNPPESSSLPAPLSTLLSPFFTLSARASTNVTYHRIESSLLDPLFAALKPLQADDEPPSRKRPRLTMPTYSNLVANACLSDPASEGAIDRANLRKALLRRMFDVASEQDTRDANRRKMYALWKSNMEEDDSTSGTEVDGS